MHFYSEVDPTVISKVYHQESVFKIIVLIFKNNLSEQPSISTSYISERYTLIICYVKNHISGILPEIR